MEAVQHVQEYQESFQFRSAGDRGGDPEASLQFVRKVSGFHHPSKANQAVFLDAVDGIASVTAGLLSALKTSAPPRNRAAEAARAHARAAQRFARWSDRPT